MLRCTIITPDIGLDEVFNPHIIRIHELETNAGRPAFQGLQRYRNRQDRQLRSIHYLEAENGNFWGASMVHWRQDHRAAQGELPGESCVNDSLAPLPVVSPPTPL